MGRFPVAALFVFAGVVVFIAGTNGSGFGGNLSAVWDVLTGKATASGATTASTTAGTSSNSAGVYNPQPQPAISGSLA